MYHHVAHAAPRLLAFHRWSEARHLWEAVTSAAPAATALVLMPDHIHLLHERDVRVELGAALSGHARWMARQGGPPGALWRPQPPAVLVVGPEKQRRTLRYVYLNPCRGRLTDDPVDWPFSSLRDALGWGLDPRWRRHHDPQRLHAYVTSDETVGEAARRWPVARVGTPAPDDILEALGALRRATSADFRARGPLRTELIAHVRGLTPETAEAIAAWSGCSERTVRRITPAPHVDSARLTPLLGDHRFRVLTPEHLPDTPSWRAWRAWRASQGGRSRAWSGE